MRFRIVLWTAVVAAIPFCSSAQKKVALVIGVRDYEFAQPLKNTLNDAQDMSAILKSKGFHVIELYNPRTKRDIQDGIRSYFDRLNGHADAAGLIFYSGHGMQVDGINYLMPTSANPQLKADLDDQGVKMEYVLSAVEEAGNALNIFILDACRNNPFRSFSRSSDPGLSQVNAPKGSYVVYATAPGSVASDGTGRNGLFTSKLIKYIDQPNFSIEQVFKSVARDVQKESNGKQVPWINYSYFGDFFFSGAPTMVTPITSSVSPADSKPGLKEATLSAKDYYERSLQHIEKGAQIEAVRWLGKALAILSPFSGETIIVQLKGKDAVLQNEIYYSLAQVLRTIKISSAHAGQTVKLDWYLAKDYMEPIVINVNREVPLTISMYRRIDYEWQGDLDKEDYLLGSKQFTTDAAGKIDFSPSSIEPIFRQWPDNKPVSFLVKISLDIEQLVGSQDLTALLSKLDVPTLTTKCVIKKQFIYLNHDVINDKCNCFIDLNHNLSPFVFVNDKSEIKQWMDVKDVLTYSFTCLKHEDKEISHFMKWSLKKDGGTTNADNTLICDGRKDDCCSPPTERHRLDVIQKLTKYYYP